MFMKHGGIEASEAFLWTSGDSFFFRNNLVDRHVTDTFVYFSDEIKFQPQLCYRKKQYILK